MSIDSENCLFARLQTCKNEFPNLISRHQYNIRRKLTKNLCNSIRGRIANEIDSTESYFCIDSKPIEVCRIARSRRCKLGKEDYATAPSYGYCAFRSKEVAVIESEHVEFFCMTAKLSNKLFKM